LGSEARCCWNRANQELRSNPSLLVALLLEQRPFSVPAKKTNSKATEKGKVSKKGFLFFPFSPEERNASEALGYWNSALSVACCNKAKSNE
jgi:hypothetical protein